MTTETEGLNSIQSDTQSQQTVTDTTDNADLINQFVQISKAQTTAIQETLQNGLKQMSESFSEGLLSLGERQQAVLDGLVSTTQQQATSAKSTLNAKQQEWQEAETQLKQQLQQQKEVHTQTAEALQKLTEQHEALKAAIDKQRQMAINAKMEKDLVTVLTEAEVQPALMKAATALFKQQLSYKESADATFVGELPIKTAIMNWVKDEGAAFVKPPNTTGGTNIPPSDTKNVPTVSQDEINKYIVNNPDGSKTINLGRFRPDIPAAVEAAKQVGFNYAM